MTLKRGENRAWIEDVADWIALEVAETGEPFVIEVDQSLGEAQARLMEALGVEVVVR